MQNRTDDTHINFQYITVQSVGQSSGIFIGRNNAIGWSAHSKNNQGLGTAKGKVMQSVNLVYDNDLVDSPIDDRDFIVYNKLYFLTEMKETANITFDEINVTSLANNAAVSVGCNKQNNWDAHCKDNTGISDGSITCNNINVIEDADIVDSPVNDQYFKTAGNQR